MFTERQRNEIRSKLEDKVYDLMSKVIDNMDIEEYIDDDYIMERISDKISGPLTDEVDDIIDEIIEDLI